MDDPAILERIGTLSIPPAWTEVRICPWPNGHIQAIGIDAAGRKQYRYHDEWRRRRDAEKFARMTEFGAALPTIRAAVTQDLHQPGLPRTRVLALAVRLLDIGMFRIGGEEYAETHETYGVATIEKRHVRVHAGSATFDYPAKGGKRRVLVVSDPEVVDLVATLKRRRGGGEQLLVWRDGKQWADVRSHDVNTYLKEISGGPFSAKDFRTWDATLLFAVLCAQLVSTGSKAARGRQAARLVREVSEALGNTPAVCRKSYIDPRVVDRFEHGETIEAAVSQIPTPLDRLEPEVLCQLERALLTFLEDPPAGLAAAS